MNGLQEKVKLEFVLSVNRPTGIEKKCLICKKEKSLDNFCLDKSCKDSKSPICRQCGSEKSKVWRDKNNECLKEKRRVWNGANKDLKKVRDCIYRKNNKEKIKERKRLEYKTNSETIKKRSKLRYEKTKKLKGRKPIMSKELKHLSRQVSCGIWRSIQGNKKNRHWELLVGYTIRQLKEHLEKQFQLGMSWNNYGKWHLDHKIPISAFNFESFMDVDFKKCWSLKNLQPLWAKENLSKHNKIFKPFQPSLAIGV